MQKSKKIGGEAEVVGVESLGKAERQAGRQEGRK